MRNIWTIAKRELDHYYSSPMAYVVGFAILFVIGIILTILVMIFSDPFRGGGGAPTAAAFTDAFGFMLVLSIPALTMRLVSDEHRMGTLELLLTAPVRDSELIIGKWLGAFLFILSIIALSLLYPLILNNLVEPGIDQMLMLSAYLGVILISAAFLGIGVGFSAIFSNQIAAFFLTLITFVFLYFLVNFPANYVAVGADFFNYLSVQSHFHQTLNRGVIMLGDLVYFISLTALGLFVGTTAVEMRRWR